MRKTWSDIAWDEYVYWQTQDKKTLKRINQLLKAIDSDPYAGIGKPEPLKYDLQGFWSRRIDENNRLIYRVVGGSVEIVQCRSHYDIGSIETC